MMVVEVAGTDRAKHMTVAGLVGQTKGRAAAVAVGVGSWAVVARKDLRGLRCSSSNFRCLDTLARPRKSEGRHWMQGGACRTWHQPGCMYLKDAPQACGHSSGQQWTASHGGRAVFLSALACAILREEVELCTVLAHRLAICPSELRSQLAYTLVQLLYLRFA